MELEKARSVWRKGAATELVTRVAPSERIYRGALYSRRWEEEKCFDTWKNDFSQAKAWGKSAVAIENQVLLAIITSILIALCLYHVFDGEPPEDGKALRKQKVRDAAGRHSMDGTDRPRWTATVYRFTTKISRQVIRFFQNCFDKIASPALYQRQLRPLFEAYL